MSYWTAVSHDTPDKPEVMEIAETLGVSRDEAFGLVVRFWCWCDQHAAAVSADAEADGLAPRVTKSRLVSHFCHDGFADALESVGWASFVGSGMIIPRFAKHMGKLTRRRRVDAARKRVSRSSAAKDHDAVTHDRDPVVTAVTPRRDPGVTDVTPGSDESVTTKQNKTGERMPAAASSAARHNTPAPDGGAAAVVSSAVAGEACGPWLSHFRDDVGVRDADALAAAGGAPPDDPRMAWIASECAGKPSPAGFAATAILAGWSPPHGWEDRRSAEKARARAESRSKSEAAARASAAQRDRESAWAAFVALDDDGRREVLERCGGIPATEADRLCAGVLDGPPGGPVLGVLVSAMRYLASDREAAERAARRKRGRVVAGAPGAPVDGSVKP